MAANFIQSILEPARVKRIAQDDAKCFVHNLMREKALFVMEQMVQQIHKNSALAPSSFDCWFSLHYLRSRALSF